MCNSKFIVLLVLVIAIICTYCVLVRVLHMYTYVLRVRLTDVRRVVHFFYVRAGSTAVATGSILCTGNCIYRYEEEDLAGVPKIL